MREYLHVRAKADKQQAYRRNRECYLLSTSTYQCGLSRSIHHRLCIDMQAKHIQTRATSSMLDDCTKECGDTKLLNGQVCIRLLDTISRADDCA